MKKKCPVTPCSACIILFSCLLFFSLVPLAAAEPYEGWQRLTTDHFLIIFEPKDHKEALELASFADDVHAELTMALQYVPTGKIPVILAGRTAFANGSFGVMPNRITLYITSPDDRFMGARTAGWLRSVFTHELTHYIHLTSPVGIGKFLGASFGPGMVAFNQIFMPLWWIEGITVYAESAYSTGGRGDSPLFALQWQAPLQEQRMWSLAQGAYSSHLPPSGRYYPTGYVLVDYLVRHYGEDAITGINDKFTAFPFLGMNAAFRSITGKTPSRIFSAALREQVEEMLPRMGTQTGSSFSPEAPGTYSLPYRTEAGLLGLVTYPDQVASIVSYGEDGTGMTAPAMVPGADELSFSVSNDGLKAVYSRIHGSSLVQGAIGTAAVSYADLVLYNLQAGTSTWLTLEEKLFHPALSPDGSRLVAIEAVSSRYRLVEVSMADGSREVIYDNPASSVYEPRFSPDGKRIAFIEISQGLSSLRIWEEEKIRTAVPSGRAEIRSPRFSDDSTLLFSSDAEGSFNLYSVSLAASPDESSIHLLFRDPVGVLGAVRDGERYIFTTYTSDGQALRSIPVTDVTPEAVTWETAGTTSPGRAASDASGTESTISRYHDLPRFSYWLPVLEWNSAGNAMFGATASFASLLQKNSLALTAVWQPADRVANILAAYQYSPGPFTLTQQAEFVFSLVKNTNPWGALASVTSLTLPLAQWHGVRGTGLLRAQGTAQLRLALPGGLYYSQETAVLQYDWNESSPATALFGRNAFQAGASVSFRQEASSSWQPIIISSAFLSIKKAVAGRLNHVLGFDADVVGSHTNPLTQVLLPSSVPVTPAWEKYTGYRAKLRTGLSYSMPWAIDQPVPGGGATGIGLTLKAETMGYLLDSGLAWEEDVYLSAELGVTLKLGSLSAVTPKLGIIYSPARKSTGVYISILGTALSMGSTTRRMDAPTPSTGGR